MQRGVTSTGSQPILNINTASDINIYNNSFIVNTDKPQPNIFVKKANAQSRSNSSKQNN